MLSIAKMAGGQEAYYLELAREDYYLGGGEPPGQWWGSGARTLGLVGEVAGEGLAAVLAGRTPKGVHLGQEQHWRDGRSRQPGWDLTFSAPKGVSTLWSQVSPLHRAEIEAAHGDAVRAALTYLEDTATFTRRGQAGAYVERAKLVVATFLHGTSRAQDPQLHTHALVANLAERLDGTWGALRSRDLYQHKMAAGALYRAELAYGLKQRLGLELEREDSWFRVRGVPVELTKIFSTRRGVIESALAEHGWSGARASEVFARTTREVKRHVAREVLDAGWQEVGNRHGFSRLEAESLLRPARVLDTTAGTRALDGALRRALSDLVEGHGSFTERELVRRVATAVQATGARVSELLGRLRELVAQDPDLVPLPTHAAGDPNPRYASRSLLADEARLLELVEGQRGERRHLVGDTELARALAARPTMKDEQRRALVHITQEAGTIKCVSGLAGTGKTYLLDAAHEAWRAAGYEVRGAAISARAALELERGTSIPSQTVASLLWRLARRGADHSRSILVVDEAAMVGTRDMKRLIEAVTGGGGKVVLVGDETQLQPIGAGQPFGAIRSRLGGAELREITRQYEPWMRHAVEQFREGDARGALTQYALAERLHIAADRETASRELVGGWLKHRSSDAAQNLILAGTREAVARLNELVQAARVSLGELDPRHRVRSGKGSFHVGDRVIFTRNMRALGVVNGDFGTIEAIHEGSAFGEPAVQVRLDRARRERGKSEPLHVTAPLDGEGAPSLAYAVTTHKAQGATVDRAFVLAGGWMQDRELSYVQMSRARERCHIYSSEADAGDDLVELERAMQRSRQKSLLHEQLQEQEQEHSHG